jgi:toxoflavin biosynthesis protein ToxC
MRSIELKTDPLGHAAPVTHVALREDGARMASCSYDGTVIVWDIRDPTVPRPLARLRHRRLVNAAAWHPSRPDRLATASADKTVGIWQVTDDGTTTLHAVLARHTDDVNSLSWTPDGARIVCVSEDGRASLWDVTSGRFIAEIGAHTAHCMMVSISRTGLVATVGEDGRVIVTDLAGDAPPAAIRYDSSIEGCAWSHAGDTLAIARDDGKVVLLTTDLSPVRTIGVSSSATRTVAWSPDDQTLLVGSYDGSVCWYDRAGTRLRRVLDERQWPRSVAAAAGVVAVGSFHNRPHLFDRATARPVAGPTAGHHGPNALTVRRRELLVGCDSGVIIGYDLTTGRSRVLPVTGSPILSVTAGDDACFAATYARQVLRVEDGMNGTAGMVTARTQLDAPVPSLCVSGDRCVAGTYNGSMVVLDRRSLAVVERHEPHDGSIKSLAPSPAGVVSGATDRRVTIGPPADRTVSPADRTVSPGDRTVSPGTGRCCGSMATW